MFRGNATITSVVKIPATYENMGTTTYTAKITLDGTEYTSTKDVVDIFALGHAYGEWTLVREATLEEFGEERRVCAHDAMHFETRQLPKRVQQLVEPDENGGEIDEVIV